MNEKILFENPSTSILTMFVLACIDSFKRISSHRQVLFQYLKY